MPAQKMMTAARVISQKGTGARFSEGSGPSRRTGALGAGLSLLGGSFDGVWEVTVLLGSGLRGFRQRVILVQGKQVGNKGFSLLCRNNFISGLRGAGTCKTLNGMSGRLTHNFAVFVEVAIRWHVRP